MIAAARPQCKPPERIVHRGFIRHRSASFQNGATCEATMRKLAFVVLALFGLCWPAAAQTVVIGPNGVTVYGGNGAGYAYGDGYAGAVHPGWRGKRWHDRRDWERGKGHHNRDWERRGGNGYGYGEPGWGYHRDDARYSGNCRRIDRRDWIHGRRVIVSEVVCFDRSGRGFAQPGSVVVRDCPEYYRSPTYRGW
jgi:hypothetical protein